MDTSKILFRCSKLGHLKPDSKNITDNQEATIADYSSRTKILTLIQSNELQRLIEKRDSKELPEEVITNLVDIYVSEFEGRKEIKKNKYLKKGNVREPDSLTLLARVTKTMFHQNDIHLSNDYIKGTPDTFIGESIYKADETFDTKTSWSRRTNLLPKFKKIDPMYLWQGHGYMWLTGAKKHTIAYCLVNGTIEAIMTEKKRISWEAGMIDDLGNESPEYIEECKQIEINHIFDIKAFSNEYPYFQWHNNINEWYWDIPMEKRVNIFVVNRDEAAIELIKKKVDIAREWMANNLFDKSELLKQE